MNLKSFITDVPDFPIQGVLFRDIGPLLQNAKAFDFALEALVQDLDLSEIDAFVGIESRGFILAAALAAKFRRGFIPLRKAGKLPPPVKSASYTLEYGTATLEMKAGSGSIVLIDDVLATGGTLEAAITLCEQSGYDVRAISVLINLTFLNRMTFNGAAILSAVNY